MKKIARCTTYLVLISLLIWELGCPNLAYARKKERIPENIPIELRAAIKSLSKKNPMNRASAANKLGKMGEEAAFAVPFLIPVLKDESRIARQEEWHSYYDKDTTTPAEQARKALARIGKPAVPDLIAALKDRYMEVRFRAAKVLGEIKDRRAVEGLIEAIRHNKHWRPRRHAAEALGAINDPAAVPPLIDILADKDGEARRFAAEALGKLKDPRAVPVLIESLKDSYVEAREEVARALGDIADPRAIDPLIAALEEDIKYPEAMLAEKDKSGLETLTVYGGKDTGIRSEAAGALGKIGNPRATLPLIAALKDEYWCVRWEAAEALGNIKDPRAVLPLTTVLLDDPNWLVREYTAKALGKLKDARAANILLSASKEDIVWRVREKSAIALAGMKDPRSVESMIELLKLDVKKLQRTMPDALKEFTGQDFGKDAEKWQNWWERNKETFLKDR